MGKNFFGEYLTRKLLLNKFYSTSCVSNFIISSSIIDFVRETMKTMTKMENIIISILLMFFSIGITLGMFEAYFRLFYDETDSLTASLSAQRWY